MSPFKIPHQGWARAKLLQFLPYISLALYGCNRVLGNEVSHKENQSQPLHLETLSDPRWQISFHKKIKSLSTSAGKFAETGFSAAMTPWDPQQTDGWASLHSDHGGGCASGRFDQQISRTKFYNFKTRLPDQATPVAKKWHCLHSESTGWSITWMTHEKCN